MWDTFQRSEFLPSRHPLYEKRTRSMAAMERNYEAVCFRCHLNFIQCTFINIVLDQLHQSVSDSKHSEPCRRVFIQTETQDAPALRWRHLDETTEKRKKRIPERGLQSKWKWTRHDACDVRGGGIGGDYEGLLALSSCVYKERAAHFVCHRLKGTRTDKSRQTTQRFTHGPRFTLKLLTGRHN